MTASLTITLDAAAVQKIVGAGQTVTLAQTVTAVAMSNGRRAAAIPPVSWLAFPPLEANTVTWNPAYQIFATTTPLAVGNVLVLNATTAVRQGIAPGTVYTFANGVFTAETGSGAQFRMSNQTQGAFSFGLTANALVNGTSLTGPLNALPVLYGQDGFFSPPSKVLIFLSSASVPGTVLPTQPDGLQIPLGAEPLDASVCFDDTTNTFFLC